MKTSAILFGVGLILPLLLLLSLDRMTYNDLKNNGAEAAVVQNKLAFFGDTIRANGPTVESTLKLGYFKRLSVSDGIQIIHDAALGNRVKAVGPRAAVDNLTDRFLPDDLATFGFKRPILLDEPVKIYLDLDAHTIGNLEIRTIRNKEPRPFPALITKTPVKTEVFTLNGFTSSAEPIKIDNFQFQQTSYESRVDGDLPPSEIRGKTKRLFLSFVQLQRTDISQLECGELTLFKSGLPSGQNIKLDAETISISYQASEIAGKDAYDRLSYVPDTVTIGRNTTVKSHLQTPYKSTEERDDFVVVRYR